MNFVIPMAGHGKRFSLAGYNVPKMMIRAHGKSLLQWSVDSLPLKLCTNLVFIGLKEHEEKHHLTAQIKSLYGGGGALQFVYLEKATRGQAETVLKAEPLLFLDRPILIFNIDTCFHSPTLEKDLMRTDVDGILGAFNDKSDRYSYALTDSSGDVLRVEEKNPISSNALTGLYHFSRTTDFLDVATVALERNQTEKGEFYVAPLYNPLIAKGRRFILNFVSQQHILGTPEELVAFENTRNPN